ncbi:MAG: c-type cytochrome domain-containing protein [Planctomycetota bacterium]
MTARNLSAITNAFAAIALIGFTAASALADISPEQRRELTAVSTALNKANSLFGRDQFTKSAEEIAELHDRFEKLAASGDADVLRALEELHKKFIRTHALLELEGIELPPLPELKPAAAMSTPSSAGGGSSFVKDVAPMLVAKCGKCHVEGSRGDFNMANYEALMKGSKAGVVVFPSDPAGSRIVEVIESGDMPRGGSLSPQEFTSLKNWIAAGAKYDGTNPQDSLNMFVAAGGNTPAPVAAVATPTGKETISFAADIAPVLVANCNGCHVNAQNARGNLNMSSFAGMLTGGDGGPVFTAGNSANSLIVRRIKGEGGEPRMPMDREPLSDEVIAKFEKWIAEGATYDGPNPTMNVVQVAALAKAKNSTHEQLSADRVELALQNWNLGMGGAKADQFETKNFFVVGNVGPATLEEYGKKAEELTPKVAPIFGARSDEPLIKGRMSLFLFKQRYDYSEFGQMVEKRELPKEWRGHWNFTIIDAYGAFIPPSDATYTLDGLVAQQLAGTYIASLNSPPRWFSEGCARVAASRLAAKDPRVASWKNALGPALGKMVSPSDFLTGKMPPEDADIASFSFVTGLMKDSKRFNAILDGLRAEQDFNQLFLSTYGASPEKVAEIWARTVSR